MRYTPMKIRTGDNMENISGEYYTIVAKCDPEKKELPDEKRLQGLYRIGEQLFTMIETDELMENIIRLIAECLPMERCMIGRCFVDSNEITPIKHNLENLPDQFEDWPISCSVIREVLKTGKAILGCNTQNDPKFINGSFIMKKILSFICAPLGTRNSAGERSYGFIYVDISFKKNIEFNENDLKFLTALSPYIELAMKNAEKLSVERNKRESAEKNYFEIKDELIKNNIVGSSKKLTDAFGRLRRASDSDVSILLLGERGTGKELFAKACHQLCEKSRRGGSFVIENVAAIPENMIESLLFGYEKGSFTGANEAHTGDFELAHGGTLFLDEIGDMPHNLQAKLLRVLQDKSFRRLGGKVDKQSDFRLICATNKDLNHMVMKNRFKPDLLDRISDIIIHIPPLRERTEDIPELVVHFTKKLAMKKCFSAEAMACLKSLPWAGNIRQLYQVVKRIDVLCDEDDIHVKDILPHIKDVSLHTDRPNADNPPKPKEDATGDAGHNETGLPLAEVEKKHIIKILNDTKGQKNSIEIAATILGVSRATLYNKIKKYDLEY
jgi:transcriptional regulator with GAF, ATPase, and Fis domain